MQILLSWKIDLWSFFLPSSFLSSSASCNRAPAKFLVLYLVFMPQMWIQYKMSSCNQYTNEISPFQVKFCNLQILWKGGFGPVEESRHTFAPEEGRNWPISQGLAGRLADVGWASEQGAIRTGDAIGHHSYLRSPSVLLPFWPHPFYQTEILDLG